MNENQTGLRLSVSHDVKRRLKIRKLLPAALLTASFSVGCVGSGGKLNAQAPGGPSPSSKSEFPDFMSIFSSKKKNKSVEGLVRSDDGKWHFEGTEDAAVVKARTSFDRAAEYFRQNNYSKAAGDFHWIVKNFKDTPIEEDALFMEAECYFKMDKYPSAQDKYTELMTRFPTTRFMPQAVQRTYDIAYFWLEDSRLRSQGKESKHYAITNMINILDPKRPLLDTEGRAVEAIQSIQAAEPAGPLTDHALMMAAAHSFTGENYVKAAGYYEQVAVDMPKSEHAQKALVLGAQAYKRAYEGPNYDGVDLENAFKLTTSALKRPDLPDDQRARLEADLRVIYLERAKRDFASGEQYRRMRRPGGARYYYQLVMKKYPDTDWARRAKDELDKLPPEATKTASNEYQPQPSLAERIKSRFAGGSTVVETSTQRSVQPVQGAPNLLPTPSTKGSP